MQEMIIPTIFLWVGVFMVAYALLIERNKFAYRLLIVFGNMFILLCSPLAWNELNLNLFFVTLIFGTVQLLMTRGNGKQFY